MAEIRTLEDIESDKDDSKVENAKNKLMSEYNDYYYWVMIGAGVAGFFITSISRVVGQSLMMISILMILKVTFDKNTLDWHDKLFALFGVVFSIETVLLIAGVTVPAVSAATAILGLGAFGSLIYKYLFQ